MIHKKNVINLGLIGDDTVLPVGQKCIYYLYYKADKDLYLYDSENDIETNLFHLEVPARGRLEILAEKFTKGFLRLFAFKVEPARLLITAYKEETEIPAIQGISIYVRTIGSLSGGTLSISATKEISMGTIEVNVKEHVFYQD
jgi:hypothetical protein